MSLRFLVLVSISCSMVSFLVLCSVDARVNSDKFEGTGVSLLGNTSCSYTVSIDGASESLQATEGTLYSKDGLSVGTHNVSVTADASASGQFWFDRADISRPLPAG